MTVWFNSQAQYIPAWAELLYIHEHEHELQLGQVGNYRYKAIAEMLIITILYWNILYIIKFV